MASNTQYQGGGMGKKHMPPLVAKPIITVTEFTPGNTPDRVIIFAIFRPFFKNPDRVIESYLNNFQMKFIIFYLVLDLETFKIKKVPYGNGDALSHGLQIPNSLQPKFKSQFGIWI